MSRLIKRILALIVLSIIITGPFYVSADRGVGVGTGKIVVDEELVSGVIYNLPPVMVLNTGDEASNYTVTASHRENQPELKPPAEWFSFEPEIFFLKPGESQRVDIKLTIPLKTIPGDYFAFMEASVVNDSTSGVSRVGAAAASKLYFTIAPANFVQGIYYRTISLWREYMPWTNIVGIAIAVVVAVLLFKKYFKLEINLKKGEDRKEEVKREKK